MPRHILVVKELEIAMNKWDLCINGKINTYSIEEIKLLDDRILSDTSIRKKFKDINSLNVSNNDKAILRNKARFKRPRTWKVRRHGKVKEYTSEQILKWDECVFDDKEILSRSLKGIAYENNSSRQPDNRYIVICGKKEINEKNKLGFTHVGLWKPIKH